MNGQEASSGFSFAVHSSALVRVGRTQFTMLYQECTWRLVVSGGPGLRPRHAAVMSLQTCCAAGHSHMTWTVSHPTTCSHPRCGHPSLPRVESHPESLLLLILNSKQRCWLVLPGILWISFYGTFARAAPRRSRRHCMSLELDATVSSAATRTIDSSKVLYFFLVVCHRCDPGQSWTTRLSCG